MLEMRCISITVLWIIVHINLFVSLGGISGGFKSKKSPFCAPSLPLTSSFPLSAVLPISEKGLGEDMPWRVLLLVIGEALRSDDMVSREDMVDSEMCNPPPRFF